MAPTRWAICGTGLIAVDFTLSLKSLPSDEHEVVAVAARDKSKAEKYAAEYDIPESYGSYAELANLTNVDIVYIATININHVELSLMYINAGKNVLCEKPMAMTLAGCQKVLAAAKEKGVFFMEGFWTRFFPAYKFIQEHVKSGALGEVKIVDVNFTQNIIHVPRVVDPELGGGGILDIGCYVVLIANLIFKGKPEKIMSDILKADTGVDKAGVIYLRYPGGKIANLMYSCETLYGANSMVVRGTKGNVTIPDQFWCPSRVVLQSNEVKYFQVPDVEGINFTNSGGFRYQAQGVRESLLKGEKECPVVPHEDSETIAYIIDTVLKQAGITPKFP